jgi:hypothetical protein
MRQLYKEAGGNLTNQSYEWGTADRACTKPLGSESSKNDPFPGSTVGDVQMDRWLDGCKGETSFVWALGLVRSVASGGQNYFMLQSFLPTEFITQF